MECGDVYPAKGGTFSCPDPAGHLDQLIATRCQDIANQSGKSLPHSKSNRPIRGNYGKEGRFVNRTPQDYAHPSVLKRAEINPRLLKPGTGFQHIALV